MSKVKITYRNKDVVKTMFAEIELLFVLSANALNKDMKDKAKKYLLNHFGTENAKFIRLLKVEIVK